MSECPQRINRASWLWKQSDWRLMWDQRFFVLEGLRLAYHIKKEDPEKKVGCISSLQRHVGSSDSLVFRVWLSEGYCWTLRAATEREYEEWTSSITAALRLDEVPCLGENREGMIYKKTSWTGQWKKRFFELDGCRIKYRVEKINVVRGQFILVAVDVTDEKGRESEMFLTTSCGNRFWVKFSTVEQCNDWRDVILRGLRRITPWQWLSLVPSHTTEYGPLRVQFHASVRGHGTSVFCFGGTTTLSHLETSPLSQVALPVVQRGHVGRQLSCIQLSGEHQCFALEILPFEEGLHAKRLPPPLYGAAMCVLTLPSSHEKKSSMNILLLVGGRSERFAARDVKTEVWCSILNSPSPKWNLFVYDASLLPHRTFHTLTVRDSKTALLCGGIDDQDRLCDECYTITWPSDTIEPFMMPPLIKRVGNLPEPRMSHVCLTLSNESLLILGVGCCVHDQTAALTILQLPRGETQWYALEVHPALPSMRHVCATNVSSTEREDRIFILGESYTLSCCTLKFFELKVRSSRVFPREIDLAIGAVPRNCCGAAMHHAEGYLYILGGCYEESRCCSSGSGCGCGVVQFQNPLRVLLADDERKTVGS